MDQGVFIVVVIVVIDKV